MSNHLAPEHEAQRLAAVAALACTADMADPALDALVRVAAQSFGVPAAVISLMQADHQVFVARVGVDVSELARTESLCEPVLASPQSPLVVEDLSADPARAQHPLVQGEPHVRLYAGAALCDDQGLAVGTLVLLDTQPAAPWTEVQRRSLQDLALVAARILQDRRRLREQASAALVPHGAQTTLASALPGLRPADQFQEQLEAELAHAMRTGEPFALLALDIDGIDTIEAGFGAAAAELALHDTVQRLAQQVRLGDVLARLGPTRFGVLMRHGGDDEAEGLQRRIAHAVAAPLVLPSGDEVGVGLAMGVAAYTDATESLHQLQEAALTALEADRALQARRWQAFTLTR